MINGHVKQKPAKITVNIANSWVANVDDKVIQIFRVSNAVDAAMKFTTDANNTWILDHAGSDEYNLHWKNQHGGTSLWQRMV